MAKRPKIIIAGATKGSTITITGTTGDNGQVFIERISERLMSETVPALMPLTVVKEGEPEDPPSQ